MNNMKKCSKCKIDKPLNEFSKYQKAAEGKQSYCKSCGKIEKDKWNIENREHIKAYVARKWKENPEKIKAQSRAFIEKNPHYHRDWKNKYKQKIAAHTKLRRDTEPLFKLRGLLRHRIKESLKRKNFKKNKRMVEWLGCSVQDVAAHLERQFKPGMTWENHGKWHIDHIVPLSSATTTEEMYQLCHFTNLQPLWAAENLSKNGKMPW